jgi:hypothetical protein
LGAPPEPAPAIAAGAPPFAAAPPLGGPPAVAGAPPFGAPPFGTPGFAAGDESLDPGVGVLGSALGVVALETTGTTGLLLVGTVLDEGPLSGTEAGSATVCPGVPSELGDVDGELVGAVVTLAPSSLARDPLPQPTVETSNTSTMESRNMSVDQSISALRPRPRRPHEIDAFQATAAAHIESHGKSCALRDDNPVFLPGTLLAWFRPRVAFILGASSTGTDRFDRMRCVRRDGYAQRNPCRGGRRGQHARVR